MRISGYNLLTASAFFALGAFQSPKMRISGYNLGFIYNADRYGRVSVPENED